MQKFLFFSKIKSTIFQTIPKVLLGTNTKLKHENTSNQRLDDIIIQKQEKKQEQK